MGGTFLGKCHCHACEVYLLYQKYQAYRVYHVSNARDLTFVPASGGGGCNKCRIESTNTPAWAWSSLHVPFSGWRLGALFSRRRGGGGGGRRVLMETCTTDKSFFCPRVLTSLPRVPRWLCSNPPLEGFGNGHPH